MAVWGARNGYVRLGYDYSVSPKVTGSTSSVTVTLKIYLQAVGGWITDNYNTLRVYGDWSYTRSNVPVSLSAGQTMTVATLTKTVSPSYAGTVSHSFGVSMPMEGGKPSLQGRTVVAKRPVALPHNPSNFAPVRKSDREVRLTWRSAATTDRPVVRYTLNRQDNVDTTWRKIADLGRTATSYVDKGTRADRRYRYTLYAHNDVGHSSGAVSSFVVMTPAAPSAVTAWLDPQGVNVGWTNNATYQTQVEIYDNGTLVGTAAAADVEWTHVDPDRTVEHRYTVVAVADGRRSAHSVKSNAIRLAMAARRPVNLDPNGPWYTLGTSVSLVWDHAPADGSSQTAFQIRYRENYADAWTTLPRTTSGLQAHARTFNAETVEWQVRTWGMATDKDGPWSDSARFFMETAPILTLTGPPAGTLNADSVTVTFAVSNKTAWSWEAEVVETATGAVHRSASGQHTNPSWFVSELENGKSYQIRVRARSFVFGAWVSRTINVVYPSPPPPTVETEWDRDNGTVKLTVSTSPGNPPAVHHRIERVRAAGPNVVLFDEMPLNGSFLDRQARSGAPNTYRIASVTALGIEAYTTVTVTDSETYPIRDILVVSEDGGIIDRLRFDPEASRTPGLRDVELHHFIGRNKPVMYAGTQTSRLNSFAGVVLREDAKSQLPRWDAIAVYGRPLLVRDPDGTYMWAYVSNVAMERDPEFRSWIVSFSAEEVEYGNA